VIARLLKQKDIRLRRSLGQHFLADQNIADKVVEACCATPSSQVFEIGAGIGTLTVELARQVLRLSPPDGGGQARQSSEGGCASGAKSGGRPSRGRAGRVVAVEIDEGLCAILEETTAEFPNVTILRENIMELALEQALVGPQKWIVVADLPYHITTPVIFRLLENLRRIRVMVLMVQKEVGERIEARPGSRRRGALSVAVQARCSVERVIVVPSTCFFPRPGVDSMAIRLTPLRRPMLQAADQAAFRSLVQAAFGRRRKMLLNALQGPPLGLSRQQVSELLDGCSIDGKSRPEALDTEDFAAMARSVARAKGLPGQREKD
jgi:16S rRNA (adenine1518-N6/adenine1519-N6)-dimethyltransferase